MEAALERLLPGPDAPSRDLHRAMRYAVLGGGKRLRPLLLLAAADACGWEDPAALLTPACALEMIHQYSLIHDDLPCMDDDDFRRGRPSCHRAFGEALAVLAGDALLTLAFECLARPLPGVPAERQLRALAEVAAACGAAGMVGGQADDVAAEGMDLTVQELQGISRRKTGALFQGAIRGGAILAGANDDELDALTGFAREFGLAFQIVDDILDAKEPEGSVPGGSAAAGSDARKAKATFPALVGLDASRVLARAALEGAETYVAPLGARAAGLIAIARQMLSRA